MANQIADAITGSLEAQAVRGSWEIHMLCGAPAAVAQAMTVGEDLASSEVIEGVMAAAIAGGAPRPAAGLAGHAAADALMKLSPVRHFEDARRDLMSSAIQEELVR